MLFFRGLLIVLQIIMAIASAVDVITATETLTIVLASICVVGWSICAVLNSILFIREWKEWRHID